MKSRSAPTVSAQHRHAGPMKHRLEARGGAGPDEVCENERCAELRGHILNIVSDMMSNLLYYDRKEDSDVGVGDIELAISDGVVTVEEIVNIVKKGLSHA